MSLSNPEYRETVVHQEIDGITYTSTKHPTTKSLDLLARTVTVLGEAGLQTVVLANMSELGVELSKLVAGAEAAVYRAAVQLAYGLKDDPKLPRDLLERVKASSLRPGGDGGPVAPAFEAHFQGEVLHLVKVLGFVLGHNFAGFTLGTPSPSGGHTSDSTDAGDL